MLDYNIVSTEAVSPGHPDKIADFIADYVAWSLYSKYGCRTGIEVQLGKDYCLLGGEVGSQMPMEEIHKLIKLSAEEALQATGYKRDEVSIIDKVNIQSVEIANQVLNNKNIGAGDNGIMFGYARNNPNTEYMPEPIALAQDIISHFYTFDVKAKNRKIKPKFDFQGNDGKVLVSFAYKDGKPLEITKIIFNLQHTDKYSLEHIQKVVRQELKDYLFNHPYWYQFYNEITTDIEINPNGTFILGGAKADTGVSGRKLIVDSYGGFISHGGGATSGKDYTKVDRTFALLARYIAKSVILSCKDGSSCFDVKVQISSEIGNPRPVSINIVVRRIIDNNMVGGVVKLDCFNDLTLKGVLELFNLKDMPFYYTTNYGLFGANAKKMSAEWENCSSIVKLK